MSDVNKKWNIKDDEKVHIKKLHGTVPYGLLKLHEKQFIDNYGISLDSSIKIGCLNGLYIDIEGLNHVGLYCLLNDIPIDKTIKIGDVMTFLNIETARYRNKINTMKLDEYGVHNEGISDGATYSSHIGDGDNKKVVSELRPCIIVSSSNDRHTKKGIKAYFHTWFNGSNIMIQPDGSFIVANIFMGLVEYEDGSMYECSSNKIMFTDRGDLNE